MEQLSYSWFKARLAKITGSNMTRVMGGPRAWSSYARQIREEMVILERIEAGEEIELGSDFDTEATSWGRKWEPAALAEHSFRQDCDVDVVGFVTHPKYPFIGCSVDGKVYKDGGLLGTVEVKCPYSESIHLHTLSCGVVPGGHIPQIQSGTWIMHVDRAHFVSFDPRRDLSRRYFFKEIKRDDEYIALMEARCLEFWDFVNSKNTEISRIKSGVSSSGTIPQLF